MMEGKCGSIDRWLETFHFTLLSIPFFMPLAPTQYDNLWETITNVFKAALGEILEFAKTIIDKLGQFLCDSGDTFTDEAAATNPPADCGVVGQVSPPPSLSTPKLLARVTYSSSYTFTRMHFRCSTSSRLRSIYCWAFSTVPLTISSNYC
jgi:hypothetical protein